MYNNTSYEEYMINVLGYTPRGMQDTFTTNDYYIMQTNNSCVNNCRMDEIDDLYPDMYKKVYPIVCKECNTNTMPITREILEQMTDNVLNQIEINLKIQTNVKMETIKETNTNSRLSMGSARGQETNLRTQELNQRSKQTNLQEKAANLIQDETNNRSDSEDRSWKNNTLRDLIKILILRELIDRGRFPNKPPFFPPRPPMQGTRPPFSGGNRTPYFN